MGMTIDEDGTSRPAAAGERTHLVGSLRHRLGSTLALVSFCTYICMSINLPVTHGTAQPRWLLGSEVGDPPSGQRTLFEYVGPKSDAPCSSCYKTRKKFISTNTAGACPSRSRVASTRRAISFPWLVNTKTA